MNKILFLDIDGVLNSYLFMLSSIKYRLNKHFPIWKVFQFLNIMWLYHIILNNETLDKFYLNQIDEKAVLLLNDVINETGCKVVLSSSWRKNEGGFKKVEELLKIKGFIGEIIDATPTLGGKRGNEIEEWLTKHDNIENYVIVDDESDFTDNQILNHFVWTDRYCGFTTTSAYKCIYKLNNKKYV
jgi:hypothetical protein